MNSPLTTIFYPRTVRETRRQERALLLLAVAFVAVNSIALSLALDDTFAWQHLWAPGAWLLLVGAGHLLLNRFRPERDPLLFPLYSFLTGWGLLLIDRLAPNFLGRQALWLVLGMAALLAAAVLPRSMRLLRRYRYTWLTLGLALLVATLVFGVNPSGAGAALWLPIPLLDGVFFQPSELMKLLLVVFLASYFDEQEHLSALQTRDGWRDQMAFLAPLLLMWGLSILLLVWQRDLGAAALFFVTFLALLYLATGLWRYVATGAFLLGLAAVWGYLTVDLVRLRIDAWLNPWPEATDRAFQIVQSLYALGAGGVTGQGVGQGFPFYVPVVHSDFIFAAVGEEWGMVGSIAVVACFAVLGHRGLRIASVAERPFHAYLAAGITIILTTQAFLIMAGVTRLLPLTGVTLPLMSYGGSSLLISSLMFGLLLYLSGRNHPVHK